MNLDDYDWRPITFQGETFPPSLMGISILEPVLGIKDEQVADWLWRFPICRSLPKSAPAEICARCAAATVDLMRANKEVVLEGIRERLGSDGFDPETTFREWGLSLMRIADLSLKAEGECRWSVPSHKRDKPLQSKEDALRWLELMRKRVENPPQSED